MSNTARFITLTGSILVLGFAATTGCSADPADGGGAGRGGSAGAATTGGTAGAATTGGTAGAATGGSAGAATGGSAGAATGGSAGAATGGSAGAATGGSAGSAGGGTCPGPGDFDDGDPCTFTGMCPAACGIEELGTRTCSCATTADCDSCMPPDATMYPITAPATACDPDVEATIRDMPCTTEGAACTFTTGRGCVCWNFSGAGTTWTCGSVNSWF